MSKIDELRETYTTAYETAIRNYDYDDDAVHCIAHAERAGIAAVVRALRDEIDDRFEGEGCDRYDVQNLLNEILGDARNEKVAGVPTREDGWSVEQLGATSSHAITSPATAPAPAVCEWTQISEFDTVIHYSTPHGIMNDLHLWRGLQCSACHAPIKFTEAKP